MKNQHITTFNSFGLEPYSWIAQITRDPRYWSSGVNEMSAIGMLWLTHGDQLVEAIQDSIDDVVLAGLEEKISIVETRMSERRLIAALRQNRRGSLCGNALLGELLSEVHHV